MGKKKISVGTWAYIWGGYEDDPIPFPKVVKDLANIGFDGIEFGAFPPHYGPEDYDNREKRMEIKKMLDDHGLGISGLAGAFWGLGPATTEPDVYMDMVKRQLAICNDMGIDKLRVDNVDPPNEIPGGLDYETAFGRIAEIYNQAAEACAAEGVSARLGTAWTTDAVFRETREEVTHHQRDGVLAVEMECSALFTVGGFRGIEVAALLVVSDDLSSLTWHPGFKDPRFIRGRELACNAIGKLCATLAAA